MLVAMGFWHERCLPASITAMDWSACMWVGVSNSTASTLGSFEHLLKGGVDAGGDAPLLGPAPGAIRHRVAEGHDLAALVLQVAGGR